MHRGKTRDVTFGLNRKNVTFILIKYGEEFREFYKGNGNPISNLGNETGSSGEYLTRE